MVITADWCHTDILRALHKELKPPHSQKHYVHLKQIPAPAVKKKKSVASLNAQGKRFAESAFKGVLRR